MKRIAIVLAICTVGILVLVMYQMIPRSGGECRIGVVLPLTGVQADQGADMKKAMEMALASSKQRVKVVWEDSQSTPNGAVSAVRKLADVDHVPIIIGTVASSETLACAPICEEKRVVLFSPTASSPKISDAGDYIFRSGPLAPEQAVRAAGYARQKMGARKAAILYMQDDTGIAYKDSFLKAFQQAGGVIVYQSGYKRKQTDFQTELAKIKAAGPDVIYAPATSEGMGYLAKQRKELGISTPILANFGIEGSALLTIAGSAANGIVYTCVPVSESFVRDYQRRFGKAASIGAPLAFDAMDIVLNLVGTRATTSDALKKGLYSVKDVEGVCGKVSVDAKGDAHRPVVLKTVKDGAYLQIGDVR